MTFAESDLTPRERIMARLIGVECLSTKVAAKRMGISFRTAETHRYRVMQKLEVLNVAGLARMLALEGVQ